MSDRFSYGSHASQFVEMVGTATLPAAPLAVMIHGGFWRSQFDLTTAHPLCVALAASGFLVANIEYRRVGESGGGWPGTFDDVRAAFTAVRDRFPKSPRPIVLGHSAGGHLAVLLATTTHDIEGVVALAPVACLDLAAAERLGNDAAEEFMGESSSTSSIERADPSRSPSSVPRTIVHGIPDELVPISLSRTFVERRQSDPGPVRLIEVPGASHRDLIDPGSLAWPAVLSAVQSFSGSVP